MSVGGNDREGETNKPSPFQRVWGLVSKKTLNDDDLSRQWKDETQTKEGHLGHGLLDVQENTDVGGGEEAKVIHHHLSFTLY